MKTYAGSRTMDGIRVTVNGRPLDERQDLKKISNAGFEWTYEGKAPAQLALALLADHLNDDRRALSLCEVFMRELVATLENDWELTGADIDAALDRLDGPARVPDGVRAADAGGTRP